MRNAFSVKPLVFVAMPFGRKRKGRLEIDFDLIYDTAIEPSAVEVGLDVIRASEEPFGGIIHLAMFERLLMAEIVVADLTIGNPNVFYELGIRHCARPRSTILMFAGKSQLPFDVKPLRAIEYPLGRGAISPNEAKELKALLKERLEIAKADLVTSDSPLFSLIPDFPGVEVDRSRSVTFRDRVQQMQEVKQKIRRSARLPRDTAHAELRSIEEQFSQFHEVNIEIALSLLLAYRDIDAWGSIISTIQKLPQDLLFRSLQLRQMYAMALNRRKQPGDEDQAIEILEELAKSNDDPETFGLLGRIYKDRVDRARNLGHSDGGLLDRAIEYYRKGFEADPREFYPGINACTLLFEKGEQQNSLQILLGAVEFALDSRHGVRSDDYWVVASKMELAVLKGQWDVAQRCILRLQALGPAAWMTETTASNLNRILQAARQRGEDREGAVAIIEILKNDTTRAREQ